MDDFGYTQKFKIKDFIFVIFYLQKNFLQSYKVIKFYMVQKKIIVERKFLYLNNFIRIGV